MRIVVQRVHRANCLVDGEIVSEISAGMMALIGFTHGDNSQIVDKMIDKLLNLRIFEDEARMMNKSIRDIDGSILAISQFTLYAKTIKGNRPSFTEAMNQFEANELYEYFLKKICSLHSKVKRGVFGADMTLELSCDGPVTITLEIPIKEFV